MQPTSLLLSPSSTTGLISLPSLVEARNQCQGIYVPIQWQGCRCSWSPHVTGSPGLQFLITFHTCLCPIPCPFQLKDLSGNLNVLPLGYAPPWDVNQLQLLLNRSRAHSNNSSWKSLACGRHLFLISSMRADILFPCIF